MNQFIPFLDLKKSVQGQRQKLNEAWDRVLDSGHFVLGKELTTFEEKFAKAISSEWSLGCANGTDTLEIGLKALNIGPGDEVITTPLTAMPTLMGISATGATIRLADVNAHDGLISTKEILKTISSKTKAIVPVHLYGQICDMEEITSIAKKNNIKILEDCAQSFGAKRNGKSSGSWGDLASWSFYPTKNLGALGDGGALSGNTAELKNLVSYLRNYGQSKTYHHDFIGRNSRLDELQAAILSERLDFSQSELKARLNIANFYLTELKNKIKIISSNLITDSTYSCYHLFVISCPYNRDLFQQNLKEQGVGSLVHYPIPAHKQKAFSFLKYSLDDFPNANSLSQTVLSLPLNPYMSELEMKRVSDAVKKMSSKIYYLFWLFLTFTMFIIPIKFFDFYSDDFGYFLNFNNQLRNETSFANALISYLTGGVPRLQLGWHLTHQILYAFIGTNVIWYFVIQSIVIFANCVLLFKLLQNYIENKLAFIITTFFLINCYYIESYYWVSANYCFYQVFFLLASFLLFNKSLEIPKGFFKYLYIFSSSFALLLSVLYQEQSLPFLIGASIILFFLNKNQVKQRTLLLQNLVYLFLTLLLLLLTFLPQVLLISQSSSTSLVDTFRMYYPSPIDSSFENLKYIFRKAFLGFIPEYKVLSMLLNNLHNIDKELKKVLMLQITFFLAFGLFFYKLLTKANSEEKPNQFKMNHWIAILGWFFGTIIVVLPIKYFVSRYVYFILPPAIIIFFLLTKRFIHLKLYNLVILLFFLISFSHNLSFLYGAYFPLIQIERKVAPLILKSLRDDNIIKAIVFEQFPSNIEGITSGVFLNYHATEWWLRWRSLPQDIGAKVVGINASPCVTEKNEPGFMLAYGEYPKERLQKCFSMEETLFVRLESSIYDSKPIINIIKKKPIYLKISNLENINKGLRSFYYFDSNIDFSSCEVRVKANINTNGIANIRLYSKGQERFMERLVVNSSGSGNTTNIELAGSEVATQKGPYQLGFSVSKPIFSDPDEKLFLKINSLEFSACKNDQFIEKFYENHNPDPNNPYMRWINLKNNFSIQIPYKESMIWEKYFGIGINNASNTGDFYCFPDDELIFTNLNTKTTSESYLGMLKWNRTEKIDSDQILINFDRNPNLLTFEHSTKDKMLIEEFKTYKKSIPPLDIKISHLFQLKKPYSKTSITLKSRSKEPGFFKWTFQDSSVFDFNVGTDRGVETISNDLQIKNQQFLSKNKNIFPITYRIMAPIHRNMAVFEWSCSKYLDYYFTSDSPSSQNEVEFSDVLKLQNVYSKNENLPHRNHGLVFKGFIKPNEEIKLTYFKSIITDWENIDELKSKTDNLVNILKTKECSHE